MKGGDAVVGQRLERRRGGGGGVIRVERALGVVEVDRAAVAGREKPGVGRDGVGSASGGNELGGIVVLPVALDAVGEEEGLAVS